jgi:hypothetical protein
MYSLSEIVQGIRHPTRAERELARWYYHLQNSTAFNDAGIDIFEASWDNMLILDACRCDEFQRVEDLGVTLESRMSQASATAEFVRANFTGQHLHDTVYVSANFWYPKLADKISAEVHAFRPVPDGSSDQTTIEPDEVTNAAREAARDFPNKRLLVHYTQPHYPYLGETGKEYFDGDVTPNLTEAVQTNGYQSQPELVRRAYRENLEMVLDSVAALQTDLPGKTVITADHGELIGERLFPLAHRQYGHPEGVYADPLVKVPWQIHNSDQSKTVVSEPPDDDNKSPENVDERLRNLGYKL